MRRLRHPAVLALLLAPMLGEWLTGATPPLNVVLWPPGLILLVAMYGGGAVLCREIARRNGLGLAGLCVLAAGYAVFEEALVDRFWFKARPSSEGGLGHYSEVWHTNVLLAANLTVFHIAVSMVSTIVLVEVAFPGFRQRPWVSRRGLAWTAAAFLILPPLLYGDYSLTPMPQLALAALLMALLVLIAVRIKGRPSLWASTAAIGPRRRGLAVVAFLAAAANLVLMGLSDTETPWPAALLAVLAPVALAAVFVRYRSSGPVFGRDGLRVVMGILLWYCVFAAAVGLAGRFDITLGAFAVAWLLWRIRRRATRTLGPDQSDRVHHRIRALRR